MSERSNGKICSFQVMIQVFCGVLEDWLVSFLQTVKDDIFLLFQSGTNLVLPIQ